MLRELKHRKLFLSTRVVSKAALGLMTTVILSMIVSWLKVKVT